MIHSDDQIDAEAQDASATNVSLSIVSFLILTAILPEDPADCHLGVEIVHTSTINAVSAALAADPSTFPQWVRTCVLHFPACVFVARTRMCVFILFFFRWLLHLDLTDLSFVVVFFSPRCREASTRSATTCPRVSLCAC
jgi:hypothetical protein